jgi:toluene monooxygenase system ferredoxin subunit
MPRAESPPSAGASQIRVPCSQAAKVDIEFTLACALDDLWIGDMRLVEIDGEDVLLVRTEQDEIHAVQAVCPHQSYPLEFGELDGSRLTCAAHLWELDVVSGTGVNPSHARMTKYRTLVRGGEIYVALDDKKPMFVKP